LDHFIFSFVKEFLPLANQKGVSTIGMKVRGLGNLAHEVERSLRYTFGLPLNTVIVGLENVTLLEQNLSIAELIQPMKDDERLAFFKDNIPSVRLENMRRKTSD
jgi:hypothetical protein